MFSQSEYAYSANDRNTPEGKSGARFHYFVTNANIGGQDIPVKLHVRENIKNSSIVNRYYYHNLENTEGSGYRAVTPDNGAGPGEPYPSTAAKPSATDRLQYDQVVSNTTVQQNAGAVNGQVTRTYCL